MAKKGTRSLKDEGLKKVKEGISTIEEVNRAVLIDE